MESKNIVTIDPENELRFTNPKDGQLKAYLTITNVSQGNIAYKVKTTAPRYYVVKPNQGILDKGQKINVDITLITAPENKVEDNKFLVQVASCDLSSSETYALQTFWDKLDKKASVSFKLKVSISSSGTSPVKEVGTSGEQQDQPAESKQSFAKLVEQQQPIAQQPQAQNLRGTQQKQEFEKAPDDEINQSRGSLLGSGTPMQQTANQGFLINKKYEELKRQYELVQLDTQVIQQQINDLKKGMADGGSSNAKDQYAWQQDAETGKSYQLIHLLIASLICIFIGWFLGPSLKCQNTVTTPIVWMHCLQRMCFSHLKYTFQLHFKYGFIGDSYWKSSSSEKNSSPQHPTPSQHQKAPLYSFQQHHHQPNSNHASSTSTAFSQNQNVFTANFSGAKESDKDLKAGFQFFLKQNRVDSAKKSSDGGGAVFSTHETSEKGNNMSTILEERTPAHKQSNASIIGAVIENTGHSMPSVRSHSSNPQIVKQKSLVGGQDLKKRQYCLIHLDKPLEYFCQQCIKTVCSKCMFHHHNGHDLSQMDDALKILQQKLTNFDQKVKDVQQEHEELKTSLLQHKNEIESMRTRQISIIEQKFQELLQKLEERKQLLTKDLMHKYDSSMFKANDKIRFCKEQNEDMTKMQSFYQRMIERLSQDDILNSDGTLEQIEILNQVPEFDKFIYENTLKLKNYQLNHKTTKNELQGGEIIGLKPIEVTVHNAMNLISTITFDNSPIQQHSNVPTMVVKKPSTAQLVTQQRQLDEGVENHNRSSSLNASFNFPKGPIPLGKSLPQKPLIKNPILSTPQPNQSSSSLHGVLGNPNNDSHHTQSASGDPVYNSKFAKLKFNRQGTSHSQELTLQVQPSSRPSAPIVQTTQPKEEVKIVSDEEDQEDIQSQKIKLLDNAIYCVGDSRYILMFDYRNQLWQQIYYDKIESDYQGTLKFMSICQVSHTKKREFLMTGGCNKATKEPSNQCFKFSIPTIRQFREVQRMKQPRYGHASVYINQLVLVMGGFNHRDDDAQAPNTLNTCEKYSIKENEWTPIAPMQQERAYFSACRVKEEFVYVFGGFQNYETSNSIEFYNIMLDKWTMLSITMPLKLAKYGLAKLEDSQIVICGGLLVDNASTRSATENASYSCVNTVYKFDCNTLKWTKLAKLNFRRTLYSTMAVRENGQIFAIGGTVEGINEVYDIRKKKWNTCQSYTSIMGQNDLQTYAICSLSKTNYEE